MSAETLIAAAAKVDVIDAAGRIIANPARSAPSATAAEVLALAHASERFWEVALEADILVRAIALDVTDNDGQANALRDHAIERQCVRISQLMAAIRGTEKLENGNANSTS